MASYPDGTIFESAQQFPPGTSFGSGCIFASGCTFMNPCTFGDSCIFEPGCSLLRTDPRKPPHKTGKSCVFGEGCNIEYTIIGASNIIGKPGKYSPVSEGSETVVGPGNNHNDSCDVESSVPYGKGQIVSDCKVSKDWEDASNKAGFVDDGLHVDDDLWGVHT